jgi:flagellar biosynthesis/type III secretory pathway protein FliH
MWEIRERDHGYRNMRNEEKSVEEAYECGYEDGYEDAMKELEEHSYRMSSRSYRMRK